MGLYKKKPKSSLSSREGRLIAALKPGRWTKSSDLVEVEFPVKGRPVNARLLVTVAMYRAMGKLADVRGGIKIEKRGGGRAGTEYCLVRGQA
jgi:hypothetical protein